MKGLSLAGFKKRHEDKDWATLIHKDGHEIKIAKAPLSPIHRKQIENLETHEESDYGGKVHLAEGGGSSQAPSEEQGIMNDVAANAPPPQEAAAASTSPPMPAAQPTQTVGQAQNTGLGQEQAANTALAQAQGAQGAAEAKNYGALNNDLTNLPKQDVIFSGYQDKDKALEDEYRAKTVDPAKYWTGDAASGTEGHSKLLAGIGVLLSAAGQGIGAGGVQGNAALDVIQNGINREVDRQKNAQEQSMNLWKMNRQNLGNDLAANLATQNQLATGAQYTLSQTAAQHKGPIAFQQANIANAKLQQQKDINNYKLALMNPSSDNPDPATRVSVLVPPDRQAAVTKEIAEAQNMVHNFPGIEEAFHQAAQDVRPLSGGIHTSGAAFIPGMKTPGQAAFQGRIAPTVQEAEGTVRKQAFDNIDANMTPAFGDSDQTIATKHQTFLDYAKSKTAAPNAKSFGIDLAKYPSTNTLGLGAAPPPTKTVNGQKFIRGTR